MNSYERVVTTLNGEIPDRVPIFELMIDPNVIKGIIGKDDYIEFCEEMDIDIVVTSTPSKLYKEELVDAEKRIYRNEWGMLRQYGEEIVSQPLEGPIKTLEDAKNYKAPDPLAEYRYDYLKLLVKKFKHKRLIGMHLHDTFNYPYYLSSMESLFMNLVMEPELVRELVKISLEHNMKMAEKAIDLGADFVIFGDDYGTSTSTLVSPEHFREFFIPGLKAIVQEVRRAGAYAFKHCCGNITEILDDMVDTGLNAMHPLDRNAGIKMEDVKAKYPQLMVMGGIDCSIPLVEHSTEEMEEDVKEALKRYGVGGRYAIATSNSVHSSAKPENYLAMINATKKFGKYNQNGGFDW